MMLSRVADALYWIGRYLERAEHGARLLDITLTAGLEGGRDEAELIAGRALRALGAEPLEAGNSLIDAARVLTFDRADSNSIFSSIALARENARQVRDQITTEMWERLNLLFLRMRDTVGQPGWEGRANAIYQSAIADLHAFKGIVEGTMSHGEGYRFLALGGAIERAQIICKLLELHLVETEGPAIQEFGWVTLLRMCCGLEPFVRARTADFRRESVAEFLILDQEFPRSLRFCAERIDRHLQGVAPGAFGQRRTAFLRLTGKLRSKLDYASLEEVIGADSKAFLASVIDECISINSAVHDAFVAYPLEERLPA